MKVSKLRSIVLLASATLIASLALAAPAPAAPGSSFHLAFVAGRGPTDALAGQTITSVPFAAPTTTNTVQVELLNNANNRVTNIPVTVTLSLQPDPHPSPGLTATSVTTQQGVATFSALSVGTANVAEVSDYTLVARSDPNQDVGPGTSTGFDIWTDGRTCAAGSCTLSPTTADPIADTYRASNAAAGSVITASTFLATEGTVSALDCVGYTELTDFTVWHEYTQGDTLFVVTHTARDEMKTTASNGQVSVQLCLALSHDWNAKPVAGFDTPVEVTTAGGSLFVGLAPKCPKKNPQLSAPCITAQYGDGGGGNYTEAWLPGTDPGKRS